MTSTTRSYGAVLVLLGVACLDPALPAGASGVASGTTAAEPATCQGLPATITGTSGKDTIHGTPQDDVIAGGDGDDTISGGGGDDVICGDEGSDHLLGGPGDDRLDGGLNRLVVDTEFSLSVGDVLRGGPGDDRLDVGADPRPGQVIYDSLDYSGSHDPVRVRLDTPGDGVGTGLVTGRGRDVVVLRAPLEVDGSEGDDTFIGSPGRDLFAGNGGDDVMRGLGGNDELYPDRPAAAGRPADDDVVDGGAGADTIGSLTGRDTLRGGAGGDRISSASRQPVSIAGGAGRDFVKASLSRLSGYRFDGGAGRDSAILIEPALRRDTPVGQLVIDLRRGRLDARFGGRSTGTIASFDTLIAAGDLRVDYYGTAADETVTIGDRRHRLRAWMGGGDDEVHGSLVADLIDGGPGVDEAFASTGVDSCPRVERRHGCP